MMDRRITDILRTQKHLEHMAKVSSKMLILTVTMYKLLCDIALNFNEAFLLSVSI